VSSGYTRTNRKGHVAEVISILLSDDSMLISTLIRFFMIDRMRENGELKEEFKVLGSTGNVSPESHMSACLLR
jgi:hypothetical protein